MALESTESRFLSQGSASFFQCVSNEVVRWAVPSGTGDTVKTDFMNEEALPALIMTNKGQSLTSAVPSVSEKSLMK